MIYTFYCNYYEGLEAALVQNVNRDIENLAKRPERIFETIPVVCGTAQIQEFLYHSLAQIYSIVPGIKFHSTFEWLRPYVGTSFRSTSR
ncbi:MAG: hypothetical protein LUC43_07280, partial [Burkholderiales bacterium]|nr:hypothetical protein [Burkholderiales bacterium]